jgi:hypothetical protein
MPYENNGLLVVKPLRHSRVIVTASHAVDYCSDGVGYLAEQGTGSLALLLAEYLNGWAIIDITGREGASNSLKEKIYEIITPLKDPSPEEVLVIDLHNTREENRSSLIGISLGRAPSLLAQKIKADLRDTLESAGFECVLNPPSSHAPTDDIFSITEGCGISLIQIILPAVMCPPVGQTETLSIVLNVLTESLNRAKTILR